MSAATASKICSPSNPGMHTSAKSKRVDRLSRGGEHGLELQVASVRASVKQPYPRGRQTPWRDLLRVPEAAGRRNKLLAEP